MHEHLEFHLFNAFDGSRSDENAGSIAIKPHNINALSDEFGISQ